MKATVTYSSPGLVTMRRTDGCLPLDTKRVTVSSKRIGRIEIPFCWNGKNVRKGITTLFANNVRLFVKSPLIGQWIKHGDELEILAA